MIKRVLVALDGSEHASKAIDLASAIASRFGAELIALHVMPDKPLSDAERAMAEVEFQAEIAHGFDAARLTDPQGNARLLGQRLAEQAAATAARFRRALGERLIEEAARRAKAGAVTNVRTILEAGDPATAILRVAQDEGCRPHRDGPPRAQGSRRAAARQRLAQGDPPRSVRLPDRQMSAGAARVRGRRVDRPRSENRPVASEDAMQRPLEIRFRQMDPSPAIEARIRESRVDAMKASEHEPRRLTPQDVRHILGDLDDAKIAAILATDATVEELEEAAAWASGESDVIGELERPLEGVVASRLRWSSRTRTRTRPRSE